MPKYRVQLKQGSRTIVNNIEAKSVQAVIQFFETLTTMKVTEVLKIEYENNTLQPIDDMQYYPLGKFIARNESSSKSHQFILQNIKLTKNSDDVDNLARLCLEIDGLNVTSTFAGLLKNKLV
ncbi:hypothetical protein [Sulfuricurvum sp.]|uniref:hypothetical protein n=1 Tax=Sulfuricurvum sp. TaxID=2025608 RepID=UPI002612304B|nr:hypothetical protein [Sulfuricurvum sp.]MDD4949644.1 hypothetical protein [Sulfuricurvum sp.]